MSGDQVDETMGQEADGSISPAVDRDELKAVVSKTESISPEFEEAEVLPGPLSPEVREAVERRIDNALRGLNEAIEAFLDGAERKALDSERLADHIELELARIVEGTSLEGDVAFVVKQLRWLAERARVAPSRPSDSSPTPVKKLYDAKSAVTSGEYKERMAESLIGATNKEEFDRAWHEIYGWFDSVRAIAGYLDEDIEEDEVRISRRINDILRYGSAGQLDVKSQRKVDRLMNNVSSEEFAQYRRGSQKSREMLMQDISEVMREMTTVTGIIFDQKFHQE